MLSASLNKIFLPSHPLGISESGLVISILEPSVNRGMIKSKVHPFPIMTSESDEYQKVKK